MHDEPNFLSTDSTSDAATELSRRRFLQAATATATAAAATVGGVAQAQSPSTPPAATPRVPATPQAPVALPPFIASTERQPAPQPLPLPQNQRVGFAIVGLGRLSVEDILPAFAQTEMARPVALVSGNRDKALQLAQRYNIAPGSVYDYANFDRIRDNPVVEVVYIVLPNGQHEEFVGRSVRAGKHVLCEKPMANSSAQARRMIAAARAANRKLMIAYRIQYEAYNREVRRLARAGELGQLKLIEAINGQNQGEANQWRHKLALAGGGALPDIGLYCLNTIRFILGEEPIEIMASTYSTPGDARFREVEESCLWQMRFPSGVRASCSTEYGHHTSRWMRVHGSTAWANLDTAFAYEGQSLQVSRAQGQRERTETIKLNQKNQFAAEMDHMADCVIHNKSPFTPGEEGLQDQVLMEAIYQSAREGRAVKLAPVAKKDAFRGPEPEDD